MVRRIRFANKISGGFAVSFGQKTQPKVNFHCFLPTLPPEKGSLVIIEIWKMYEMQFKSDNPSLDMIIS